MCKADGSINHEWEQIAVNSGAPNPHTPAFTPRRVKGGSERYDVERWILAKYWTSYTERRSTSREESGTIPAQSSPPPSPPSKQFVDAPAGVAPSSNISTDSTSTIRNQGYLTLYQPKAKKQKKQRQFFVLTDEVLAFFRSEAEGLATMANLHTFHASVRANGVFDIGSVTEVNLVMSEEDVDVSLGDSRSSGSADDSATFKLCLSGSQQAEYLLEAQDHATSLRWVHSIQTALLQVSAPHRRLRSPSASTRQAEPGSMSVVDERSPQEPVANTEGSEEQMRVGDPKLPPEPAQSHDLECELHQQQVQEEEDLSLAFAEDVADLEFDLHCHISGDCVTTSGGTSGMYPEGVPPPRSIPSSLTAQLTASASQLERVMTAVANSYGSASETSTVVAMRAGLQVGLGRTVSEQTVVELLSMLGLDTCSSADGSALDRSTMAAALAAINLGATDSLVPQPFAAVTETTAQAQAKQDSEFTSKALGEDADVGAMKATATTPSQADDSLGSTADVTDSETKENWLLAFSALDAQDRGHVTRDDLMSEIASGTLADCFPLGSDEELGRVDDLFAAVFGESASVTAIEWSSSWKRLPDSIRCDVVGVLAKKANLRWT